MGLQMDGYISSQTDRLSNEEIILIKQILKNKKYKQVYVEGLVPSLSLETDINEFIRQLYDDEYSSVVSQIKDILNIYFQIKNNTKFSTLFLEKDLLFLLGQKLLDKNEES